MYKKIETESQIDRLVGMANEIWTDHFTPLVGEKNIKTIVNKMQSKEAIKQQLNDGYIYHYIISENKEVGYFAHLIEEEALYLSKVYLYKAYRGKGLARKVINHLEQEAHRHQLSSIYLDVLCKNENSVGSYIKMGFKITGKKDRVFDETLTCIDYVMCKYLY